MGQLWPAKATHKSIAAVAALCFLGLLFAKFVLHPLSPSLCPPFYVVIFLTLGWIVFQRPVWGIFFSAAVLPVLTVLDSIPLHFSALTVVVMVGGIIRQGISIDELKASVTKAHVWGFLFLCWVLVSHPRAAIELSDTPSLWYLVPLLVLSFLTSMLLRTREHHQMLMVCFAVTSCISATFAIAQSHIGLTSESSIRGMGLTVGANSVALYFLIAFIFLSHLRNTTANGVLKLLTLPAMGLIVLGIASTVSRTAFLVFQLMLLLLFLDSLHNRSIRITFLPVLLVTITAIIFVPTQYWTVISGIPNSIVSGTDSVGFRYMQWKAAVELFASSPITGIGIGQFMKSVHFSGLGIVPFYGLGYEAHSMYVGLLVETGVTGFLLFALIVSSSIRHLFIIGKRGKQEDSELAFTWLLVIVALLVLGTTGSLQFNKLIWIAFGASSLSASRVALNYFPLMNMKNRLASAQPVVSLDE